MPTGQQLYWNGLGLLLQRPASRISVLTERVDYYRSLFRSVSFHADIRPPDEARWRGTEELQVAVPYLEAESLLITVTLLACAELGLSPVTDSRLHHEFMRRKLARTYENPELREAIRPVLPSVREQDIGLHTLKLHVPRIAVADVGTVLKVRRKCADSLERFRIHFRKLGHQMSAQPWTPEFQDEMRKLVATRDRPGTARTPPETR